MCTAFSGSDERGVCKALGSKSRTVLALAPLEDQKCLDVGLNPFEFEVVAISRTVSAWVLQVPEGDGEISFVGE
jgi:hypothetical protein